MVSFVLILVLVIAVLVLVGFVLGYNKIRAADVRVDEALGGIDVAADPAGVADPQPGQHGADLRRPREGHPRPRHRRAGRADRRDRG